VGSGLGKVGHMNFENRELKMFDMEFSVDLSASQGILSCMAY